MEPQDVATRVKESIGPQHDRWNVEASANVDGRWVITLTHPASGGLIIDTGRPNEADIVSVSARSLAANIEIEIASAAPELQHPELVVGVRTISKAFQWDNREVRAVAFLMFEHHQLNEDETGWLSGYEGINAPMKPVSPLA